MNLKESLDLLISQGKALEEAQNAHEPVDALSDSRRMAHLHRHDGAITFTNRARQAFRPEAVDLASFLAIAKGYYLASVWLSPERLIAHSNEIVNRLDKFDAMTWFTLEYTHLYAAVRRLVAGKRLAQSTLVREMRTQFSPALNDPKSGASELLTAVKAIKFSSTETGNSVVAKGQESVGKSVMRNVQGVGGDIPESFEVECVPYKGLGSAGKLVRIPVYVEILVEDREFYLYTLQEDIEAAELGTLDMMMQVAKAELKDGFTVLMGNPVAECLLTK